MTNIYQSIKALEIRLLWYFFNFFANNTISFYCVSSYFFLIIDLYFLISTQVITHISNPTAKIVMPMGNLRKK